MGSSHGDWHPETSSDGLQFFWWPLGYAVLSYVLTAERHRWRAWKKLELLALYTGIPSCPYMHIFKKACGQKWWVVTRRWKQNVTMLSGQYCSWLSTTLTMLWNLNQPATKPNMLNKPWERGGLAPASCFQQDLIFGRVHLRDRLYESAIHQQSVVRKVNSAPYRIAF